MVGLMWENAESFGALLVFAEHRYYGKSQPFGGAQPTTGEELQYLTMEQALADYATLIDTIKKERKTESSKVIAFGGSYGGMLTAWLRMKYPGSVDGAIAASAPILAFAGEPTGPWDSNAYWQVVTRDATAAGGATDQCADNVRAMWPILDTMGNSVAGRTSNLATSPSPSPLTVIFKFPEPKPDWRPK